MAVNLRLVMLFLALFVLFCVPQAIAETPDDNASAPEITVEVTEPDISMETPDAAPPSVRQDAEEEDEEEDLDDEEDEEPADDDSSSTTPAKPKSTSTITDTTLKTIKSTTAPVSKPKPEEPPAKKPAAKPITRTIETQLSGFTSQDADQLYARVSFREQRENQEWYIRGSHSRTGTKYVSSRTDVTTQRFDSRLETINDSNEYRVVTGVLYKRTRERGGNVTQRMGYHLLSYGSGRHLDSLTKADIGLGLLELYDRGKGTQPIFMASIRGKRPLTEKLTFDADLFGIQTLNSPHEAKLDADLAVSYSFAPGLSLRLGWSVNNLVRSVRHVDKEWDSLVRLSISYRKTVKK